MFAFWLRTQEGKKKQWERGWENSMIQEALFISREIAVQQLWYKRESAKWNKININIK